MDPENLNLPADAAATTPTPITEADPNDLFSNEDGELVWRGAEDDAPDEPPTPPTAPQDRREAPTLADLFGQPEQPTQPAPQQSTPYRDMPPEFDERFLSSDYVKLEAERARYRYQARLDKAATAGNADWQQDVQEAHQLSQAVISQRAQVNQWMSVARHLWEQNAQLQQQMEPFHRMQAARLLAQRVGIDNPEALLKHPVTGEAITDPRVMVAIASMMGEQGRKGRVEQRKGIDQPVQAGSGTGRRSIAQMDPHSKSFEAIERALEEGKTVRIA